MSLVIDHVWKGFAGRRSSDPQCGPARCRPRPSSPASSSRSSATPAAASRRCSTSSAGSRPRRRHGHPRRRGRCTGPGPDRAMVFQNYSLLPRLSLLDNIAVAVSRGPAGLDPATEVDAAVERYLTRRRAVGAPGQEARTRCRAACSSAAAVARAFAVEPRAAAARRAVRCARRADPGAAPDRSSSTCGPASRETEIVLMVTHGIDEAMLLSDRIVVMRNPPGPSIVDVIPVELRPPPRPGVGRRQARVPPRAGAAPRAARPRRARGRRRRLSGSRPAADPSATVPPASRSVRGSPPLRRPSGPERPSRTRAAARVRLTIPPGGR